MKRLIAPPQLRIGIVHFFDMFFIPKYSCLNAASSEGKKRLFFSTLRKVMFNDSIALVV